MDNCKLILCCISVRSFISCFHSFFAHIHPLPRLYRLFKPILYDLLSKRKNYKRNFSTRPISNFNNSVALHIVGILCVTCSESVPSALCNGDDIYEIAWIVVSRRLHHRSHLHWQVRPGCLRADLSVYSDNLHHCRSLMCL